MSPFRLIVFDLDGTLVDSRRDLAESANAVLEACGCRPLSEETIGRMVGDGAATLIARAFSESRCVQPEDALAQFLAVYSGRLLRCTRPYAGIAEALPQLGRHAVLAVLTNKPLMATLTILEGLDLARFFEARVIGGDGSFSRKPDPSGLQHLMAAEGVAPDEALFVGDSLVDLKTARAAGVRVCLTRYGFGYETFPVEELRKGDRVIDDPAELVALLSDGVDVESPRSLPVGEEHV